MANKKSFIIASFVMAVLIVVGIALAFVNGVEQEVGMAGGSILTLDLGKDFELNEVESTLRAKGVTASLRKTGKTTGDQFAAEIRVSSRHASAAQEALKSKYPDAVLSDPQTIGATGNQSVWGFSALWIGLGLIAASLYIFIRFNLKSALTALAISIVNIALTVSVVLICRFTVNLNLLCAVALVAAISIINCIAVFNGFRTIKKMDKRSAGMIKDKTKFALQNAGTPSVFISLFVFAVLALVWIVGGSVFATFAIASIIGVAFSIFNALYMTPYICNVYAD